MVEHFDDDDRLAECGTVREQSAVLTQTLSRRFNELKPSRTSAEPRIGAQVDVCGTVYTKFSQTLPNAALPGSILVDEYQRSEKTTQAKRKLVIILVGLPGRGKTYLCNKLICYLNWLGHTSKHFNVGSFRRDLRGKGGTAAQDAHFFDHTNEEGMRQRQAALDAALETLLGWLKSSNEHQVAIFDATNSTEKRRRYLISKFHGNFEYMFIESICDDEATLRRNCELKLKYSPDYENMDHEQAMRDFKARIHEYEKVYEPLTGHDGKGNRHLHFIKLVNMVTGYGNMDINRISGYIPGKIVFFLMQVCRSGLNANRRIWLTRHGESDYNRHGRIGGNSGLTALGDKYASVLARALCTLVPMPEAQAHQEAIIPVSCWTSTLLRTIQSARHIPFPKLRWKALDELQAGICDGHTYAEIKEKWPETYAARKADKLSFRYPAGESYMDVIKRVEPVIIEAERESSSVCVVAHQAVLRVMYGYFMQIDLEQVPDLEVPLHTLIELEPRPDGTMYERRYKVNIDSTGEDDLFEYMTEHGTHSPGSRPSTMRQAPARAEVPSRARKAAASAAAETAEAGSVLSRSTSDQNLQRHRLSGAGARGTDEQLRGRFPFSLSQLDELSAELDDCGGAVRGRLRSNSVSSCASEWFAGRYKLVGQVAD